ncbi:MAG: ribonuclease D [Candidatus Heimdallarchaeota archaeon]|nr:ribonuclease D [Candidatus Heimdallarchaeota archaeon]
MENSWIYVDNADICNDIAKEAYKEGKVGIDLESNSIFVYHEKVALLQLFVNNRVYLIDTLKINLPPSLKKILEDPAIEKIFQDMQFDRSIFLREFNCTISGVFDISIADKLLEGTSQSSSMEKLVLRYLKKEIKFSKKQQKSNWATRPLTTKQLDYASNDVKYILDIADTQKTLLSTDYRLEFLRYYFTQIPVILKERYYNENYVYTLKKKFKIYDQEVLFRLNALLIFIDEKSEFLDKPTHWLLPDSKAVEIARQNPQNFHEFKKLFNPSDRLYEIRQIIERDVFDQLSEYKLIDDELQGNLSTKRWLYITNELKENSTKFNPDNIQKLRTWRRDVANELNLIPEMLMDKSNFSYYSVNLEKLDEIINFPGIPAPFHSFLLQDLSKFLKSGISEISYEGFVHLWQSLVK